MNTPSSARVRHVSTRPAGRMVPRPSPSTRSASPRSPAHSSSSDRASRCARPSQRVRFDADRNHADESGRRVASRQNALSADYLDHYAAPVIRGFTPERWPRILTLDSQPLDLRAHGSEARGYQSARRGGAVLVAAGKDEVKQRARTWHVGLAADETEASWASFLDEIDPTGPGPIWVVMDGSKAIANAVEARWPDAIRYSCEQHLRENAIKHALDEGLLAQVPVLSSLIAECLWSERRWDALATAVLAIGPSKLLGSSG